MSGTRRARARSVGRDRRDRACSNLGTRSRARPRDPLRGRDPRGLSGDRTFRGAQTVSIRVDASSMTTISRGTPRAAARVRVEGVDEAERTAANKKNENDSCISPGTVSMCRCTFQQKSRSYNARARRGADARLLCVAVAHRPSAAGAAGAECGSRHSCSSEAKAVDERDWRVAGQGGPD